MYHLAELAPAVHRDAFPGIEFMGDVNNVSAEELKGHPKVKCVAVCQKKRGLLGASMPVGWEQWVLSASVGCWEEKMSENGHTRVNAALLIWQKALSNPPELLQAAGGNY